MIDLIPWIISVIALMIAGYTYGCLQVLNDELEALFKREAQVAMELDQTLGARCNACTVRLNPPFAGSPAQCPRCQQATDAAA